MEQNKNSFFKSLKISRIVGLILILASAPSFTQSQNSSSQNSFKEKEKAAFAKAYKKISSVRQNIQSKVKPDTPKEKKKKLTQKANQKVKGIIKKQEGIDQKTYEAIVTSVNKDRELLNDIQKRLNN